MKTIYLIGFMGSGKTTIGKALSDYLNLPVYDTDEEITLFTNKSISELFENNGEPSFRLLESEILIKLPIEDSIVTTGGGIILSEENRKWMQKNGYVVYLNVTPNEVLKRLEGDQTRPLIKNDKIFKVSQILEERMPLYLEASSIIIETTEKTVESIVKELVQRLKMV